MKLTYKEKMRYRQRLIDKGFDFGPFATTTGEQLAVITKLYEEYPKEEFEELVSWSGYSSITSNRNPNSRSLAEKTTGMRGRNFVTRRMQQEINMYEKATAGFNITADIDEETELQSFLKDYGDTEAFISGIISASPQKLMNDKDYYEETGEESPNKDKTKPEDLYILEPAKIIGNGFERVEMKMVLEEIIGGAKLTSKQAYFFRQLVQNPSVTYAEIGEELGMTRQSVQGHLKKITIRKVKEYILKVGVTDLLGIDMTKEIEEALQNA
ncbi:hypothetical protein [Bacillus manliponensis]|uniref:hypothetical protein n=1 Tax=Bacillus manliponensis TaxID=574376 RepID=UPI00351876CE